MSKTTTFLAITKQIKVVWALLKREVHVIKKNIVSTIINSVCLLCADMFIFGKLLPKMGLPPKEIAPILIGSVVIMIIMIGVVTAEPYAFDLAGNRFIDYQQTLPISLPILFLSFALGNIIRTALLGVPLFVIATLFLGNSFEIHQTSWASLLIVAILSFILIAIFALALVFYSDLRWYIDNIWPCILSPSLTLGALLFTFSSIQKFSTLFTIIFACNPFSYIAEGIRSSLIGGPEFISPIYCIGALLFAIILSSALLIKTSISQLDPVYSYED